MKLKIAAICLMVVTTSACFDEPKSMSGMKPNFQKAAELNVEMGVEYLAQGQVARAKQKFVHALELQPKMPDAHSSFGYFYETVGDIEEAEQHHKRALSYGNNEGRYYNNYGTFLCRQGRYEEADKAFNRALLDKNYIKTAELYENAGVCALKQPNVAKARAYFETALKRDPYRTQASLELAKLEYDQKNYLLANDYLARYKAKNKPTSKSVWLSLQLNKTLKKRDQVASDAQQLRTLFPDSNEYKEYLASSK